MVGVDGSSQGRLAVALSCFGLMADFYDFGIVNLVRPVLEAEFGTMTANQNALLTGSALVGAIIGQLGFGATADFIGRRTLFITTATLVGMASIGSACAGPFAPLGLSIYSVLAMWRFLMGLGIGGEYPLAAASTAENTDPATSSLALTIVFCSNVAGNLLAPSFVMLLAGPLGVPGPRLWRYAFGFGAVLALIVASLRYISLRETRGWLQASSGAAPTNLPGSARMPVALAQAQPAQQDWREKVAALSAMKWSMVGTVGVWFIYDVVTYGVGLYSTTIFQTAPGLASAQVVLFINLLTLPGVAGALFLATRVPMKHMQLYGLLGMTVCFGFLTLLHSQMNHVALYLTIFSIMRCIDGMGPGVATFAIPGQIYPTRIRATAHGISAAAGKVGAVLGTAIFPHLYSSSGLQAVMAFMCFVSAISALWTQLFTPLYDVSVLEDINALSPNMGLAQEAAMAEELLFATELTGAEKSSLVCGRPMPKGSTEYGIATPELKTC